MTCLAKPFLEYRFRAHGLKLRQGWRTSYDADTDVSLSPSRGFGDLFFKQKRDTDGTLHPAENQVRLFLATKLKRIIP